MRIWIAIVIVVGCKKSVDNQQARDLPRPTGFAAMSAEARCAATAPRARPCHNELLLAEMNAVGLPETAVKGLDKPVDDREADVLHANACIGSPAYAQALFECWSEPSCAQLAKCTVEHEALLEGSAAPHRGSDSDSESGSGSGAHGHVELVP